MNRMIGNALEISRASKEYLDRLRSSKASMQRYQNPSVLDGPLHVITGARQEGKTYLAMRWLLEPDVGAERVLIVRDDLMARWLRRDAGMKLSDPRIISFRTLMNQGPRPYVQYGVDETVVILSRLLGLRETPHLVTIAHAEEWQG